MPYATSNTGRGLIGALALTLGALGAAQFAFGRDLAGSLQSFTAGSNSFTTGSNYGINRFDVNRAAKTDRGPRVATPAAPMQTISVQLRDVTETSVAVRIPVTRRDHDSTPTPPLTTWTPTKPAIVCEPVVSVLTEVAKQLQPGRCVA
jgi:hypothetical protein